MKNKNCERKQLMPAQVNEFSTLILILCYCNCKYLRKTIYTLASYFEYYYYNHESLNEKEKKKVFHRNFQIKIPILQIAQHTQHLT